MATGFFGKLPTAGDFVSRGLPPGLRGPLDAWVTAHLAQIARDARGWPEGGVRSVVHLAGGDWLLVFEPSEDAVGRSYPLTACTPLGGADREGADRWGDAAWSSLVAGLEGGMPPDTLARTLAEIDAPPPAAGALHGPLIWWHGQRPAAPDTNLPQLARISSG